jgi:ADP-ribosylglycohydrolase/protein-tyrosine phosphatase
MRTSLSHPLKIAELEVPDVPGRLGLTFCPGKRQAAAATGAWNRDLELDLNEVAGWGATTVVTLMEADELAQLGVAGLGEAVQARGLAWHHLPIPDAEVPDEAWERRWAEAGAELRARLARGERVVLHCKGGLGRTGTVAARLLVERGVPVEDAIRAVRAVRPSAIETAVQEAHVRAARPCRTTLDLLARVRGCLLGGACGDALGAPVEFMQLAEIRQRYGPQGIVDFDRAYGRVGAITDDTQMTLFTAEGLIRACVRDRLRGVCSYPMVVHHAYVRWLLTQGEEPGNPEIWRARDGWLIRTEALWSRRAPGNTCLAALRSVSTLGHSARNDSKGCGGVMRMAPAGLVGWALGDPFRLGMELAHLTHGHPSGYLAAGYLAAVLAAIARGAHLTGALEAADVALASHEGRGEVEVAVARARRLAVRGRRDVVPRDLGQGWVAEEALAVAVWCALAAHGPEDAIILAANHDGDSDSTASIAGQIVGALHGPSVLPTRWLERLELRDEIERLSRDLALIAGETVFDAERLWDDYPGW